MTRDDDRERRTEKRPPTDRRAEDDDAPHREADFAEERTASESDPPNQDPRERGDEPPQWPTRTEGGPHRPV